MKIVLKKILLLVVLLSPMTSAYADQAVFWLQNRLTSTNAVSPVRISSVYFIGALDKNFNELVPCSMNNTGLPGPRGNIDFICAIPTGTTVTYGKLTLTLSNGQSLPCHFGDGTDNVLAWLKNFPAKPNVGTLMPYQGAAQCIITIG